MPSSTASAESPVGAVGGGDQRHDRERAAPSSSRGSALRVSRNRWKPRSCSSRSQVVRPGSRAAAPVASLDDVLGQERGVEVVAVRSGRRRGSPARRSPAGSTPSLLGNGNQRAEVGRVEPRVAEDVPAAVSMNEPRVAEEGDPHRASPRDAAPGECRPAEPGTSSGQARQERPALAAALGVVRVVAHRHARRLLTEPTAASPLTVGRSPQLLDAPRAPAPAAANWSAQAAGAARRPRCAGADVRGPRDAARLP